MVEIARAGVDPKWARSWQRIVRSTQEAIAVHGSTAVQHLEEYVRDGFVGAALEIQGNIDPVVPPYRGWESSYVSGAMVAGRPQSFYFEKSGVEGILDARLASQAFAASYTGQMIEHYRHEMFPTRFPGRILQRLSLRNVVFTALGVIIGCEQEAHRLARIQLAAFRKGYFGDKCYYPIFNFVLRLLADYLNDQPLLLEGDALKEPTLNALFDSWRLAEPTALQDIALAVCDFHTHRFKVGKGKDFYEFENGDWTRTPFEILLVFKLRQKLGLRNPNLDHPLMNTALGQLPTETPFLPDGLIARVRARMAREGYDEDAIAAAATRPDAA